MGNVPSDGSTSRSQSESSIHNLPLKRGRAIRLSNSPSEGPENGPAAADQPLQRSCKSPLANSPPAPAAVPAAPKLIGPGRDVGDGIQYGLVLDKMRAPRASRRKYVPAAKLTLFFCGVPPVEAQEKMKSGMSKSRGSQDLSTGEQTDVHLFDVTTLMNAFNAVRSHLPMSLSDDRTRFSGCVEVHLNLVHPISIDQSRPAASVACPSSVPCLSPDRAAKTRDDGSGRAVIYLNDMTTKMVIDSRTSTLGIIEGLMDKYKVVDAIANFGLYECNGERGGPGGRLLRDDEEPLLLTLLWGPFPQHSLSLQLRVSSGRKRVDTLIHWDRFTHTELGNFLRMLNQEEQKYVDIICKNYELKRKRIEKLILSREASGDTGPESAACSVAAAGVPK